MPTVSSNPTCFDIDRPTRVCFLNEGGGTITVFAIMIGAIYFRKKAADYYEKFKKFVFFSRKRGIVE